MADYLASIFGTEKDKVNCSFYFKIGACRHGEKCTKTHNVPSFSQTVLLRNLYLSPLNSAQNALIRDQMTDDELQRHFDDTYEELFIEMEEKYGEIEELNICENMSEHLAGNTYVKFHYEEDAEKACLDMNNRWFNGKPIYAELSPVTDFHEASCQFQASDCPRGGFCNFLHLKSISRDLRHRLFTNTRRRRNANRRNGRSYSRSRSRGSRNRSYSPRRDRDNGHRGRGIDNGYRGRDNGYRR